MSLYMTVVVDSFQNTTNCVCVCMWQYISVGRFLRQLLRKVCHTTAVLIAAWYWCRDVFSPIHRSGMTHTHTRSMYGNQYMDQRSPALQQCHSFSALYANTASVRDRQPIVVSDYHRFTKRDRNEEVPLLTCSTWVCTVEVRYSGSD